MAASFFIFFFRSSFSSEFAPLFRLSSIVLLDLSWLLDLFDFRALVDYSDAVRSSGIF
jgi:hypothetical protein